MMISTWSHTPDDVTCILNEGKTLTLRQLFNDGIITKEQYDKIVKQYMLLCTKKSFFSRIWATKDEEKWNYTLAKGELD